MHALAPTRTDRSRLQIGILNIFDPRARCCPGELAPHETLFPHSLPLPSCTSLLESNPQWQACLDRRLTETQNPGTAYKQYTKGPFHIAQWAHITNATIFSGPAIVATLREAALETINKHNSSVKTEITVGSPVEPGDVFTEEEGGLLRPPSLSRADSEGNNSASTTFDGLVSPGFPPRKESVVSITTTVSMKRESISPVPPSPAFPAAGTIQISDPPFQRSLLLLAQMSSADNYFSPEYTSECVRIARQHSEFVMGFIAQESLNRQAGDNFITITPGVQLPPPGQEGKKVEGTQGQQYNSPRSVIFEKGCDVVIVGRGILNATDRRAEAERYRREAWKAYEERIGRR